MDVDVTFGDAELARLCSSEHLMVRRWGRDGFEYVGRRLFELAGAVDLDHVADLPSTTLSRDGSNSVTITFDRGYLVIAGELISQASEGRTTTRGAKTMERDGLHIIGLDVQSGANNP